MEEGSIENALTGLTRLQSIDFIREHNLEHEQLIESVSGINS